MNARGYYGNRAIGNACGQYIRVHGRGALPLVGRELTDAEMRDAQAAGERAAQPLADQREQLLREWPEDTKLSAEQMTQILEEAIKVARETEKNLSAMIDKVPEHWESLLRNERNIINNGLGEAPGFRDRITKVKAPTVLPGFRDYVRRLLRKSEDGVVVIGYVAHVLPNWLRAVNLLSDIQTAAVAAIRGVVRIAKAAGGVVVDVVESTAGAVKALPTVLKVAGIAALGIGGVWAYSKVRAPSKRSRA